MLDIKGRRSSTARLVAELLHEYSQRDVMVCGRWWASVETVAEATGTQAVLSARNLKELSRLRLRVAQGPPVHGVSVHMSLLNETLVGELHRDVDLVMTWPVNDVAALDSMLAIGVTGIISDELAVLAELAVRQRGTG